MKAERRAFALDGLEMRAEGESKTIVGHAAVFNSESRDLGGFIEVIAPGAFEGHEDLDVRALNNHDTGQVLGRNGKAGTLRLSEDDTGLAVEIDPPDTSFARDLAVSMERGDITQMSFGFRTISDKWETRDGMDFRTLEKVELLEVSIVPFPAYEDTNVAMRSRDEWREADEAKPPPAKEEKQEQGDSGLSTAMAGTRLDLAERD